ncbi:hypothetical protein [Treponema denticola]|uniref:hypothetical protein n=1 Tax=Treponema denticola TaxID=158 RepID=UPI0020A44E19|nr:hypothetical protein [Treponema denticola]UTC88375.1 hypothetical protein E4N79_09550 [Treponema denticola]
MKRNIIIISTAAILMIFTGCVSLPEKENKTSAKQYNESGVKVEANKTYVRDWSGRSLGTEARPEWLMEAFQNNYGKARAKFGISDNDIVKVSMVSANDVRGAQMYADMNYARLVATELQRSICVTAAEKARNGDISEKTRQAIEEVTTSQSQVEISGHEKKAEFYHIVDEEDALSGKITRKCIIYQVYAIPEKTWARTSAFYLRKVLGDIPEDLSPEQEDVKDLVKTMMEDARHPTVMSQQEKAFELEAKRRMLTVQENLAPEQQKAQAKQELLKIAQEGNTERTKIKADAKTKQVEANADARTTAYLSGNKIVQTAAFVTPEDANRIEAEELAMSILFP